MPVFVYSSDYGKGMELTLTTYEQSLNIVCKTIVKGDNRDYKMQPFKGRSRLRNWFLYHFWLQNDAIALNCMKQP